MSDSGVVLPEQFDAGVLSALAVQGGILTEFDSSLPQSLNGNSHCYSAQEWNVCNRELEDCHKIVTARYAPAAVQREAGREAGRQGREAGREEDRETESERDEGPGGATAHWNDTGR
eukprot:1592619-Rhodomonas_salina.1